MDLIKATLGLIGITMGVRALGKGAANLAGALNRPEQNDKLALAAATGATAQGVRRSMVNGIPTVYVPRSATRRQGAIVSQTAHERTINGTMRVTTRSVGTLGDRLATILDLAEKGRQDPKVIAWVRRELSRKCGSGWNGEQWCIKEKDKKSEAEAIFKAIRRDVRYLNDIVDLDTYAAPAQTLQNKAEDCDGFTGLVIAAMNVAGIDAQAKVIRTKSSSSPDHIYALVNIEGKWVPMDASTNMGPFWEAPKSMIAEQWIYSMR